jgi:cytochrome b561
MKPKFREIPRSRNSWRRRAGTSRVYVAPLATGTSAATRHPALTVALHWGTVAALLVSVSAMFLRDALEDKFWRQLLLETHRQLGVLVLIAVAIRIAMRVRRGLADHSFNMTRLLRWAANAGHTALYLLLVALPLEGWALTNAHGITLSLLGAVHLPALIGADSELADTLQDYHVLGAWFLLGFVLMHAGAAMWHHYVRRDAVLAAMAPWLPRRSDAQVQG